MVELVLPGGNINCIRAAVANGADAVYIGLSEFSARAAAGIDEMYLRSIVDFCHERNVKVYVALNTLVKNNEMMRYFELLGYAAQGGCDAVIIQDLDLIPIIKKHFRNLRIHASTQAGIMNLQSIKGCDRVVLPREMSLDEIRRMSEVVETEVFVQGALCVSYSGLCLFSSIAGGRSGNRGDCAQPCRKMYNKKYSLSTKDLCLIDKLGELQELGVSAFKIEGRLRSPSYVGIAARIYRKVLDGKGYDKEDMRQLRIAFSREFTEGFAYVDSVVDPRMPGKRGLFLGKVKDNKLILQEDVREGDGLLVADGGFKTNFEAAKGDTIDIKADDYTPVYINSSELYVDLGDELKPKKHNIKVDVNLTRVNIEKFEHVKFVAKGYNRKHIEEIDGKADIIYCKMEDLDSVKKSRPFVISPKIVDSPSADTFIKSFNERRKRAGDKIGLLVRNRAFIDLDCDKHVDYCLNNFNEYGGKSVPILSPELSIEDIKTFRNKKVICLVHGYITLMTIKEPIKSDYLVDDEGRRFRYLDGEIFNYAELGLFNRIMDLYGIGIRWFYIDSRDIKWIRVYKKILKNSFDDRKIKKGFTTGNYYQIS
ncbi:U32 family peptidase [Candidatus Woesearchaeota archaeon]|nr:U32 family peptidase [Candidatus Woesearchaeota archaeon]